MKTLTPRQTQIIRLMAEDGLVNKQIADRLGISEGTVIKHITAMFRRLNTHTRAQAVYLFYTSSKQS